MNSDTFSSNWDVLDLEQYIENTMYFTCYLFRLLPNRQLKFSFFTKIIASVCKYVRLIACISLFPYIQTNSITEIGKNKKIIKTLLTCKVQKFQFSLYFNY